MRSLVATLLLSIFVLTSYSSAQEFSSKVFDLGMVVRDVEKSAEFYTNAIGMKEVPGFSVPGDWTGKAGLADNKDLKIRMFTLGEGEGTPKLKLMQVAGVEIYAVKNDFIHSTLGFRYLTLHVTSMDAAVERLKKAKIKTLGETPIALPPGLPKNILITVVRDPDGNFVELVGPK